MCIDNLQFQWPKKKDRFFFYFLFIKNHWESVASTKTDFTIVLSFTVNVFNQMNAVLMSSQTEFKIFVSEFVSLIFCEIQNDKPYINQQVSTHTTTYFVIKPGFFIPIRLCDYCVYSEDEHHTERWHHPHPCCNP